MLAPGVRREALGGYTVWLQGKLGPEEAVAIVETPGEVLKESRKARIRRVGEWLVKESPGGGLDSLRHAFQREHFRRGWRAAHHLLKHGILIPKPAAYLERARLGMVQGSHLIMEYLDGLRTVEEYALHLAENDATPEKITRFFSILAFSINQLYDTGCFHADLSGKNILTRDGVLFFFLDFDAVMLETPYDDARRMKNHIQLYDSFCDLFSDTVLVPFIEQLLEPRHDLRVWMPKVRQGQAARRRRIEAIWERQRRRGLR